MKLLMAAMLGLFMAGAAYAADPKPAEAPLPPAMLAEVTPENTLYLDLSTGGRVVIAMRPDVAPGHVERIRTLVRQGFYNGLTFHRVIEGFMAQGGDPKGTGEGGSSLPDLKAEFNPLPHLRGTVAMARTQEPNTANSQFYICLMPAPKLDGKYTVWGRVISGMQYADAIARGEPPENPSRIIKASIATDEAGAVAAAPAAAVPVPAPTPAPVPAQ